MRLVEEGDYTQARAQLRGHAVDRESPEFILDNLRLAVAALHDGAAFEAERALERAYPYLVAGTVNSEARQAAATFTFEGRKIWKGEPFEQAMAWYYQALVQMMNGDWENARAASRNMLFTLVDFAGADTVDEAMRQAESPEWFDENASKVENDLVLGYLMAGIAERYQNRPEDAAAQFDHARALRTDLIELIDSLQHGDYDTLLFVETGEGPAKVARGEYGESFVFAPQPLARPGAITVSIDGAPAPQVPERTFAVDTLALAQHPRWWSMRSLRETKAAVGEALMLGGGAVAVIGAGSDEASVRDKAVIGGIAAALAGLALTNSAQADLRSFDTLPRAVHLVPLRLGDREPRTLYIAAEDDRAGAVRHFIRGGPSNAGNASPAPAVYVVRLDAPLSAAQSRAAEIDPAIIHPNDLTGPIVGTYPYILGGTCVNSPTAEALAAYQAGGYLTDLTLDELQSMYREEGIVMTPPPPAPGTAPLYRHVLEGGRWLYTPMPGSAGFEELTYRAAPPYQPKSRLVREYVERML